MKIAILALLLVAAAPSDEINFTAASVNVAQPGTPVKITILRWSTEDEVRPIVTALSAPPAQPSEAARANAAAGRGRAGRGRGRGGPALAPLSPIAAFTAALGRAPTLGYIWTNEITGYSIKYAWHSTLPDGTDRIILASDRRLGAYTDAWKPSTPAPDTGYAFTLIELRLGPKSQLEGKTSLTSRILIDNEAKTVALENYSTTPTTLVHQEATKITKLR